jgi:phage shock protein PspC (stress-responsive transcriptional regulator)
MTGDPPRRLTRSHDRKIGGVAAGIAEYTDSDPTVWRLLFAVAFFLAFPLSVVGYVVFWYVMPGPDPDAEPRAAGGAGDAGLMIGVLLIGLGALMLASQLGVLHLFGFPTLRIAWPALLVIAGVVLLLRARDRATR